MEMKKGGMPCFMLFYYIIITQVLYIIALTDTNTIILASYVAIAISQTNVDGVATRTH